MKTLLSLFVLMCICTSVIAEEIDDYRTTIVPLWADTLLVTTTTADTSGKVRASKGGVFSAVLWTDGIGSGGDSVDVKLDYRILQQDIEYATTRAETTSNTYPRGERLKLSNVSFYPVKYNSSEWTSIFSSITGDNERNIVSITFPVADWIQLRITGNTDNDSTNVRAWVRFEP